MILNRLELDFFRNYPHLEADFDPRVNLIYGDNAQGKTNLLEAVAYLSSARSHRARYDREMILLGVDAAFLKGELSSRGRDFTLEAKLFRRETAKRCRVCGRTFSSTSNNAKYCPDCRAAMQRRQKAAYARRRRANVEKSAYEKA